MSSKTALLWFRQDLRLADNPALIHAVSSGYSIIPVFILDDESAGDYAHGGASRWWLHQSLRTLNASLKSKMVFRAGKAADILPALQKETGAGAVFWNRCYEPWRTARDTAIKAALKGCGVTVETFNAGLLWEPWDIAKADGTPYKVFTPFYRKGCLGSGEPALPKPAPASINFTPFTATGSLEDLKLMPQVHWYGGMENTWKPGEAGALDRLHSFLDEGLRGYKEGRNAPGRENVSRLSPHLHFGEISPRTAWHAAQEREADQVPAYDIDCFCSELGWREFSYSLLYYNPDLPTKPLQGKFAAFPWQEDQAALHAWQTGRTGIPIVDAGMRQLWQTGWMHNRVRMIVGSFLVKNLLLHWENGERWFWDTLLDADLANNSASWQWIAGCGADAAPYFRIFNPITQGEKFDPHEAYIRKWVPEYGTPSYPAPIVDLKQSRTRALAAFRSLQ